MGHRYGSGGIDGITFGTIPGKGYDADHDGQVDAGTSTGDKKYLIVHHGPSGNARRYDNENIVLLVFDPDDIMRKIRNLIISIRCSAMLAIIRMVVSR